MTSDYDRIPDQDRAKLQLLQLARQHPERFRRASTRVQARVDRDREQLLVRKRDQVINEVKLLDAAYASVKKGKKPPADLGAEDRARLEAFVDVFKKQKCRKGGLGDEGGVEAYVRFCVFHHRKIHKDALRLAYEVADQTNAEQPADSKRERRRRSVGEELRPALLDRYIRVLSEYDQKHGDLSSQKPRDAFVAMTGEEPWENDEVVAERERARRDPDRVEDSAGVPFRLAMEMDRLVRQEPDRIRTLEEWWDVLFLVLCVEYPDMPAAELGLDEADLPWGGWREVGKDVLNHRDGMRAYLGRTKPDPDRKRNNSRFWLLARRAAVHLEFEGGPDVRIRASHEDCLEALRDLGADDEASRSTAERVGSRAFGENSWENAKKLLPDLAKWGHVSSKRGSGGGSWLTPLGRREIDTRRPQGNGAE